MNTKLNVAKPMTKAVTTVKHVTKQEKSLALKLKQQTTYSLLNKCPSFTKLRQEIFGEFYTTTESIFKNHTLSKAMK